MSDTTRTRRETTRTVGVIEDGVLLRKAYGSATFRPTSITERLVEESPEPRWAVPYSVIVRGPSQTSKGADHASQTGERTFTARDSGESALSALPDSLRALLLGPDALAGPLVEVAK